MRTKLTIAFGALGMMLSVAVAQAYPPSHPIAVKGSDAGSFVNSSFSFGGGVDAINTNYGADTLGGPFISQVVSEVHFSGDTCIASDGSIGFLNDLYEALVVTTYFAGGQLYTFSDDGTQCDSETTGVDSGSSTFTVIGGNGKFAGASGSGSASFTAVDLAAPYSPSVGFFGANQDTYSGTVTP
ncbi:MAG: hypothetical protein ABSG46_05300 [Candidatus Binataceae bacterium]|jgi:hypothetical protein